MRLLNDIEEKIWYNIRRQAAARAYQLNQAPSRAEIRRVRVLPAAGVDMITKPIFDWVVGRIDEW